MQKVFRGGLAAERFVKNYVEGFPWWSCCGKVCSELCRRFSVVVLPRKGLLRIMQKVFRGGLAAERFVRNYVESFPWWSCRGEVCEELCRKVYEVVLRRSDGERVGEERD